MKKLDRHATGMALGGFAALVHAVWSLLVAWGTAQGLLDFIFSIHFLENPYFVGQFVLATAVTLVVVTFALGYVFGWVFAWVWNRVHGK